MKKRLKPAKKHGSGKRGPDRPAQNEQGPGRQGHEEQGVIVKQGKNLIKAALVYPNTYKAGMSSL
ncbi:MAG: hypothetical protein KJ658_06600, partial [Proteobacteria bacterium]|nr:hypothetical protein [Pseudomonadota bacterium]